MFNKYADPGPLINKYKNSLHYADALFGEVLSALKRAGLEKNTIIVVSSDHGEEFNDLGHGYWGHGSNFTRAQISVPLILFLPDHAQGQVIRRRSSHIDVAPTLLKHIFHCENPVSDYGSGADLLDLPEHRGLIVQSYKNKAYLIDDTVYAEAVPLSSYHIDDRTRKSPVFDYREIEQLKQAEAHFVKKGAVNLTGSASRALPGHGPHGLPQKRRGG